MKLFNKFSKNLINDFVIHLQNNDINISNDILESFLIDKPSKRKGRLSPYTVFMKEFRSNYQKQHPNMSFQEVSQAIAEQWKLIKNNPDKFEEFSKKANHHNTEINQENHKKICKATKGSDKQLCKADAKYGDYCGRHKKLAFDHVDTEDIIQSNSDSDYLSCQKEDCSRHADSGPYCSFHSQQEQKTCIKEKPNGQKCGKPLKNKDDEFCGFHNPNRKKRISKKSQTSSNSEESDASIQNSHTQTSMYYDEEHNVFNYKPNDESVRFIQYNNEPIAYNSDGDEIGIIKDNKINLF